MGSPGGLPDEVESSPSVLKMHRKEFGLLEEGEDIR